MDINIQKHKGNTVKQPQFQEIINWVEDGPDPVNSHPFTEITDNDYNLKPTGNVFDDGILSSSNNDFFLHESMPKKVHWSIPWSDLMMTMFILFAVMYIYHSTKREYLSPEGTGNNQPLHLSKTSVIMGDEVKNDSAATIIGLFDLSKNALEVEKLGHFASVDLVKDKAVRIILTGDLLFDAGMAELKDTARKKLRAIGPIIQKTPYMINVVGHTDNVPIHSQLFPTNWELSVIRAATVARFFIEEMHIPADKFYLSGHSYFQPIKPNDSSQNRALNRRVEIIMTRERPYAIPTIDMERAVPEEKSSWEELFLSDNNV